jgi:dihydrofolate synthase/folylpolyglutamate synthase
LRAAQVLGLAPAAFERGIAEAEWPARMQRLAHGKLAALVPAGAELWVDGAHNTAGGRAIANALADLEERVSRPVILVVGMLSTKDCEGFLRNFAGLAQRIVAVPIPQQEKSMPPGGIAQAARAAGIPAQESDDLTSALAAIRGYGMAPAPRILITGSLYLAGHVLAVNGTAPT